MTTIWGLPDHRPWRSHGDVGFVIRHGDIDDGDDDDTHDDDTDDDTDDDSLWNNMFLDRTDRQAEI